MLSEGNRAEPQHQKKIIVEARISALLPGQSFVTGRQQINRSTSASNQVLLDGNDKLLSVITGCHDTS
jgi:hypothetical protein